LIDVVWGLDTDPLKGFDLIQDQLLGYNVVGAQNCKNCEVRESRIA